MPRKYTDDEIIHKIKSQTTLEEDELRTLYPTPEERLAYFEELKLVAKANTEEGTASADWEEDDFELPVEHQKEAQAIIDREKLKAKARADRKAAAAAAQAAQVSAQTGISPQEAAEALSDALDIPKPQNPSGVLDSLNKAKKSKR